MKHSKKILIGLQIPGIISLISGFAYFFYGVVWQGNWDDTAFRIAIIILIFTGWTWLVLANILRNQANKAEDMREILSRLEKIESNQCMKNEESQ